MNWITVSGGRRPRRRPRLPAGTESINISERHVTLSASLAGLLLDGQSRVQLLMSDDGRKVLLRLAENGAKINRSAPGQRTGQLSSAAAGRILKSVGIPLPARYVGAWTREGWHGKLVEEA